MNSLTQSKSKSESKMIEITTDFQLSKRKVQPITIKHMNTAHYLRRRDSCAKRSPLGGHTHNCVTPSDTIPSPLAKRRQR